MKGRHTHAHTHTQMRRHIVKSYNLNIAVGGRDGVEFGPAEALRELQSAQCQVSSARIHRTHTHSLSHIFLTRRAENEKNAHQEHTCVCTHSHLSPTNTHWSLVQHLNDALWDRCNMPHWLACPIDTSFGAQVNRARYTGSGPSLLILAGVGGDAAGFSDLSWFVFQTPGCRGGAGVPGGDPLSRAGRGGAGAPAEPDGTTEPQEKNGAWR